MKKHISWLLIVLLLTGCTKGAILQEKKEDAIDVNTQTQEGSSSMKPPIDLPIVSTDDPAVKLPVIDGYTSFLNKLSAALIDGKGNKNLSPISVYLAVAMAAEGAQGETQAEMLKLLGEQSIEDLRTKASAMLRELSAKGETGELILANAIFLGIQDGNVTFHEAYLKTLADSYDASAESVRFGEAEAGQRIAAWIREKTREKIEVSEDAMKFDADTLAVLLNTIYLKDGWRVPFDQDRTEPGTFYGRDGQEVNVNYMRRTDSGATIVRGDGYLRYAIALRDVGRMVFVLPDEGVALDSLLGGPEKLQELLTGGTERQNVEVSLMVPRFTFQDRTDLEEALMGLGVKTCFTGDADFSTMTDTPAYISRVLQESHIGVDENGVVAAAYTMIEMAKNAGFTMNQEKVDFHLTRPFLYAIESREGTVLFIGTVVAPEE